MRGQRPGRLPPVAGFAQLIALNHFAARSFQTRELPVRPGLGPVYSSLGRPPPLERGQEERAFSREVVRGAGSGRGFLGRAVRSPGVAGLGTALVVARPAVLRPRRARDVARGDSLLGGGRRDTQNRKGRGRPDTRKCVSYLAGSSIFQRRVRRAHEDPGIPVCPWRGTRGAGFDKHVTESRPGASGQGPALQVEMARACAVWPGSLSPRVGLQRLQCGWGGGGASSGLGLILIHFSLNGHPGLIGRARGGEGGSKALSLAAQHLEPTAG